ncbi:MAG: type ISP restriction/modification enzyme [bacterium]|nr:type ISP restriction/modification enzyme [bacterium]
MSVLETYLFNLNIWRAAAVPETGYYGELKTLLDAAGAGIRPRVTAVIHPRNTGTGIPDLGLFDDNQPTDQKPARGVVEAKPVSDDLLKIANGEQVAKYLAHYGQVLVSNYYQFVLVTRSPQTGQPVIEERYNLAENEAAFWEAAQHPRTLAGRHEDALREYLMRVMRRSAPLTNPQDVAWMLASYAREARARIQASADNQSALQHVRQQLENALGIRFENEAAQEFFRSTLVQTLFYGLFSAWVLWHERRPAAGEQFVWQIHGRELNVPVIEELFAEITKRAYLNPLNLEQVMQWTTDALNRIDRAAFFATFNKGAAVQYFYEPFLEAFDPELRRQLGVWYTPPEVVEYMVARVDHALKTELGIEDGLADPNVYVLDPCCGTGAYLVAVLNHIYRTLHAREGDAMAAQAVQAAMRGRVFGFELLPAPFVVAHLQIGMLLNQMQAPLATGQRAGVYLTNALTGWEAADGPRTPLMFAELQKEREAADTVKRDRPILVILGNPPYSGYAGIAVEEERELTNAYRTVSTPGLPRPQGQGLNDLYVRFYRMAERHITQSTGHGIVSFISNYSWLDGLSHPGMRERYLAAFDKVYIDNLNGDRYRTGKTTPEGLPDPSIFSTDFNREGIQVGTAIATLIRKPLASRPEDSRAAVHFRSVWGAGKRAQLKAESDDSNPPQYTVITPALEIGLPFMPIAAGADYLKWLKLPEIFPASFPGVKTSRDDLLVDIDRSRLEARLQQYFDLNISHAELQQLEPEFMTSTPRYNAEDIRDYLRKRGFRSQDIVRYSYRPFDTRWLYWENETLLLDARRPEFRPHVKNNNPFIITTPRIRRGDFQRPGYATVPSDINLLDGSAAVFPLYLYPDTQEQQLSLFNAEPAVLGGPAPNLSAEAKSYLESVGLTPENGAELLFQHTLAVLHSPAYRTENAGALRQDWPRIPLPPSRAALGESAALGRKLAYLLDVERPLSGVTQGDPQPALRSIAVLTTTGGTPDFTVNVGWGHFGSGTAVMPGRGRVAESDGALDVYLNATTYWKGIPQAVWEYTLGGYQVLKKWLSYRDFDVLKRPLKPEEAREFMHIARRIAGILALNEALDSNYRGVTSGRG